MGRRKLIALLVHIVYILNCVISVEPQYGDDHRYGAQRANFDYTVPGEGPSYHREEPIGASPYGQAPTSFDRSEGPITFNQPPSRPFTTGNGENRFLEELERSNGGPGINGERRAFGPRFGYQSARRPHQYLNQEKPFGPSRAGNGREIFGPTEEGLFGQDGGNSLGQTVNIGYGPNYFEELGGGFGGLRQCQPRIHCQKSLYRTYDGSCNNLRNPQWGMAGTPYGRLLPPMYSDGIHAPPRSVLGSQLPGARVLSRIFLPARRIDDKIWTLAFMQWGQIITHDMSMAKGTVPNPRAPECCIPTKGPLFRKLSKGEPCFPVVVPRDDPMFQKYHQTCMEFLRTATDMQEGCRSGKAANPISAVTHWLDGSIVYGSNEGRAHEIRTHQGGLLRVEVRSGREWPPTNFNQSSACARPPPEQVCYKTGDDRTNQNPQLALIQIILLREHNRIAKALSQINPHWDDERIYQEARRIVIAEMQHITYYEWLTELLGKEGAESAGLVYQSSGSYVNDYDEKVNPSVLNEHAQGAFRFLHTEIQGKLILMSERRYSQGHLRLSEHLNDVTILETGAFEDLARGLTTQAQHAIDRFHTSEVTEHLFRRPENPAFGMDLKALDVQRGRDHGLRSYNDYRVHCGLSRAQQFSDFTDVIEYESAQRLAEIYEHPDDVELTVGGMLEKGGDGEKIGPTMSCILKEQFLRSRISDRYFYERGDHHAAFTPEQLTEIRKSSFARLICDNSDVVSTMQPKAFDLLSKENQLAPCEEFSSIPIVNLIMWRETRRGKFHTQFRPDYKK